MIFNSSGKHYKYSGIVQLNTILNNKIPSIQLIQWDGYKLDFFLRLEELIINNVEFITITILQNDTIMETINGVLYFDDDNNSFSIGDENLINYFKKFVNQTITISIGT